MKDLQEITAGFIGAGFMGSALIKAAAKTIGGNRIFVTDISQDKTASLAKDLGIQTAGTSRETAQKSDIVFLGVKPVHIKALAKEIAPDLGGKVLVSMAAGVSLSSLRDYIGPKANPLEIIRLMPNIAASVGEGMIALCTESSPGKTEDVKAAANLVKALLAKAGKVEEVPESLMDCVTAVSGSGPAYGFIFIEALADAAVSLGMPRTQAYVYAAQTLKGAATLVLETGSHPGALKDGVCSPGGTTIEGVKALEAAGFRSAIIRAATAAAQKSVEMGRKNKGEL
jgi:pyrroline-5-carboxylate reductase